MVSFNAGLGRQQESTGTSSLSIQNIQRRKLRLGDVVEAEETKVANWNIPSVLFHTLGPIYLVCVYVQSWGYDAIHREASNAVSLLFNETNVSLQDPLPSRRFNMRRNKRPSIKKGQSKKRHVEKQRGWSEQPE